MNDTYNPVNHIGSNKKFLEMTRPLFKTDTATILEVLVYLETSSQGKIGTESKIVQMNIQEVLTEIALRN